jgi:hypothetical protein
MATRTEERAGALTREIVATIRTTCGASPEDVYAVLADVRTHAVWGGDRQSKKTRIVEIDVEQVPAVVGTEFTSVGTDPMGRFADRSVVTDADPGRLFGFVTQARLTTTKRAEVDWTVVHRYELSPTGDGSQITYTYRVARLSAVPGMLRLFNVPVLGGLLRKVSASVARRGVRQLVPYAEERAAARAL